MQTNSATYQYINPSLGLSISGNNLQYTSLYNWSKYYLYGNTLKFYGGKTSIAQLNWLREQYPYMAIG